MLFPILSVIIFTPLIAGVIILLLPANRKTEVRVIALAAASVTLALSVWAYFSYNIPAGGYQLVEKIPWLPALGISYFLGIDGISAPLVLLGGIVLLCGVLISWGVEDRPREFFAFLMFLEPAYWAFFVLLISLSSFSF